MYDVIVIGTGGVGSATLYELARRGVRVLGLDRFPPGHDRGSSHGQTRIIRRSYFEHPAYVPLLDIAYDLWDELCEIRGAALLNRTGLVYFGVEDSVVIQGVRNSAAQHRLSVSELTRVEAERRFPQYTVPADAVVLYEPDAGYLLVEECIGAFIEEAMNRGAETRQSETVLGWSVGRNGITVETDAGRYTAGRLVVTAGCWSTSLLADLRIPLQVVRKHLHWYATSDERYDADRDCPCFFYDALDGYFYGFPNCDGGGIKVAEHSGGTRIADPLSDNRSDEAADTERVQSFLKQFLPGVSSVRTRHEVCFYTMSPDEHFIIDRHPEHDSIVIAAGLSGHGFKFAPALARVLTELTLDGHTTTNIDFLSIRRLRD